MIKEDGGATNCSPIFLLGGIALKEKRVLIVLTLFVFSLVLGGFLVLNMYLADNYSQLGLQNEAVLLRSIKLNYLSSVERIVFDLEPLEADPSKLPEILEMLSNDLVYAGLFDYYGDLLDDFGYSLPADLSSSLFFENISYSDGYPRAEIAMENDTLYIQTGILLPDDTVFIALLDRFGEIIDLSEKLYERDLLVYYGDERDFRNVGKVPEIDNSSLFRLFRSTMNSQRPESLDLLIDGVQFHVTASAIYDSDNWDVKAFFVTAIRPSSWEAKAAYLTLLSWIAGVSCAIFAVFILYLMYRKVARGTRMSRTRRVLFASVAFLPAVVIALILGFTVYGNAADTLSEEITVKTSRGWFWNTELLGDHMTGRTLTQYLNTSRLQTGQNYLVVAGEAAVASTIPARRLDRLSLEEPEIIDGYGFGIGKFNSVIQTYGEKTVGDTVYRVIIEQTPRENSKLSIQFFSIGLVVTLALLSLISGFIVANISSSKLIRRTFIGYGFLLPALVHLVWWAVGPMAFALFLAFRRWSILDPAKPFVGMQNFVELFADSNFWNAMKNTAAYSLYVPIGMFISLLLAIAVNKLGKLSIFLRVLYYLPVVTAGVATTIVWRWIFNRDFGVINYVLNFFGIPPIAWLDSPQFALISMMIIGIWGAIGSQMLIFLAGLQGIPKDFYDAASVDGASKPRIFWKITLPLLKPTSLFVLVTSVIGSFQVFTPVYVLTQGGPLRSTDVVFYHIWEAAWVELRMGYAAAQSWILFMVLAVLTLAEFKLFGKESWKAYF